MNSYPEIAKMLGVEIGQEFYISGKRFGKERYIITQDGFSPVDDFMIDNAKVSAAWRALLAGEEIVLPCEDKSVFICHCCGFSSSDKSEVDRCRASHLHLIDRQVFGEYRRGEWYPHSIKILAGGKMVRYTLDSSQTS